MKTSRLRTVDSAADDNRIAEIRVLNKQVAHRRYRDVFIIETQKR